MRTRRDILDHNRSRVFVFDDDIDVNYPHTMWKSRKTAKFTTSPGHLDEFIRVYKVFYRSVVWLDILEHGAGNLRFY